jgi:uncharacterized protein
VSERIAAARDDDSYAPQVRVKVAGKDITAEVLPDVIDLRVTLQKDELGGFTMQLANHFEVPEAFAASNHKDSSGNDISLRNFRHSDSEILDVFEPVTLELGYEGRMSTMFVGEITMLQPSYPSSGVPTFTVTGIDMMNRLRRSKPGEKTSKAFHDRADWEIAEQIAKRHKLRFSKQSTNKGPKHKQILQRNLDDLHFLLYLAKRNEFECSVIIDDDGKPSLYFGTPRDKRDSAKVEQLRLGWGESLISFTPKMRIGSQVSKVTVRGWDARKKDVIKYTATLKDIPKTGAKGKTAAEILEEKAGAKEERIVDRVVQSEEEAKRLAIQLLTETANEFLTGSGETIGEPKLRPQTNVELVGLGKRFDGVYYVTKTDHIYGASGYTTSFDVERMRVGVP